METELEISEEQAILFFQGLKKELQCNSTQRVVSLMRFIVTKLGIRYTARQLTRLISQTPGFIHLLFVASQDDNNTGIPAINHLDELADALFLEDSLKKTGLFRTEIEALNSATIVLIKIQNLFKQIGLEAYNYTLRRELTLAIQ